MLTRLEVPAHLHRNASRVVAAGYEHSGETLINLATRLAGIADLSDIDVLDMGCGVRHTMTIINRGIPIKSYTGVEVNRPIVDFLKEHVEAHDPRFRFSIGTYATICTIRRAKPSKPRCAARKRPLRPHMAVLGLHPPGSARFRNHAPVTEDAYPR